MKKSEIFALAAVFFMLSAAGCGRIEVPDEGADSRKNAQADSFDTDAQEAGSDTEDSTVQAGEDAESGETQQSGTDAESDGAQEAGKDAESGETQQSWADAEKEDAAGQENLIYAGGMTLEERIRTPEGFVRTKAEQGSLLEFLRSYPVKKDKSPVLLYDGTEKRTDHHAAVFALPLEPEDLQQCADSVMRMYAEYFWESGQKEKIAFHFTNGFYAQYEKWRDGGRIQVNGNQVSWVQTAGFDDSYENFQKFMRIVFTYAGTLSMEAESKEIKLSQIRAGDIFLRGASPGHVVMLVDLCEAGNGRRAFLLAQGYMPAQEFHVLKNPMHEEDPWYYEDETEYPFVTPEYTFAKGSLRRPAYE